MKQSEAEGRRERILQFGFVIGREFPATEDRPNFRGAMIAQDLMLVARELNRLGVYDCNYGLSKRQEKRQQTLLAQANELAAELGTTVVFNRDPRGYALFLALPSGYTYDIGGRGYPVPED